MEELKIEFMDILPYIVSILSALIAYCSARKQAKDEINRLVKQHELDLDKQRSLFEMEKEKMKLEYALKLDLLQKETENKAGAEVVTSLLSAAINSPQMQQELSKSIRKGANHKK